MYLTEADIEKLGERHKERLRKAAGQFGSEAPDLAEIQTWMVENHIETPEVLETVVRKLGPGSKAGEKKMS